jgi:hypothetical protein
VVLISLPTCIIEQHGQQALVQTSSQILPYNDTNIMITIFKVIEISKKSNETYLNASLCADFDSERNKTTPKARAKAFAGIRVDFTHVAPRQESSTQAGRHITKATA